MTVCLNCVQISRICLTSVRWPGKCRMSKKLCRTREISRLYTAKSSKPLVRETIELTMQKQCFPDWMHRLLSRCAALKLRKALYTSLLCPSLTTKHACKWTIIITAVHFFHLTATCSEIYGFESWTKIRIWQNKPQNSAQSSNNWEAKFNRKLRSWFCFGCFRREKKSNVCRKSQSLPFMKSKYSLMTANKAVASFVNKGSIKRALKKRTKLLQTSTMKKKRFIAGES